jgi:LysR family hydrogen peroxide-inducible transcriptional activator
MDLRQLTAIVAVADHRTFSAAARALHTVQSNISTHVAHLERELGVTLVDRATGRLTEEGSTLVGRARRILSEVEALIADVAAVSREVEGVARVGIIGTTARWLAPRLLEAMEQRFPRVTIVVVDATTTSLLPQLHSGQLELAIIALPINDPDVEAQPLFEEDGLVIAPSDHPLAAYERVSLATLAEHELLLEPPGTAFRDDIDGQARRAGVTLRTKAEVDGMRLLASLAFDGFGAALLPASAVPPQMPAGATVVAVDDLTGRFVGLAWRRRGLLSAPARVVVDVVRDVVATEADRQPGIRPVSDS